MDNREEIKQDIRLRLWHMMNANFFDLEYTKDELEQFCIEHAYGIAMLCSKSLVASRSKYNKRHENIDNIFMSSPTEIPHIEFFIDFDRYKKILTPKELQIFQYLVETGNSIKNFDSVSRQLGYTGKGSSKYNLIKIAKKVLEFNKNLTLNKADSR